MHSKHALLFQIQDILPLKKGYLVIFTIYLTDIFIIEIFDKLSSNFSSKFCEQTLNCIQDYVEVIWNLLYKIFAKKRKFHARCKCTAEKPFLNVTINLQDQYLHPKHTLDYTCIRLNSMLFFSVL